VAGICAFVLLLGLADGFDRSPELSGGSIRSRSELDAYELYLKGRYTLNEARVGSTREAVSLFEQAINKNPAFAPAYAALANCYHSFLLLETMPPGEILPKIWSLSRRALEIDPTLAEAHASIATALAWQWKMKEAETEYQIGLRSNPNSPHVHHRYSVFLAANGEHQRALVHMDRAIALEPLSAGHRVGRSVVLYWARQYRDAAAQAREAVQLAPNVSMTHHILGAVYLHMDRAAEGVRELRRAAELSGGSTFDLGFQGLAHGLAGDRESAHQILARLIERSQHEYVAPLSLALVHLGLGNRQVSLAWIDKAYVDGASQWPFFLAAPLYDPVRLDPKFEETVRRIGLTNLANTTLP
jgi:tetratricopeptide (TPR) repeat protein